MVTCCDELLFRLGRNNRGPVAQAAGLPQKWLIASAVSAREHRLAEGVQIDDGRDADDETAHAAELARGVNYAALTGATDQIPGQLDLLTGQEAPPK